MTLKKLDVVDFLDSDEASVEYLNAALAENDPGFFAKALGNAAHAKGISTGSELNAAGWPPPQQSLSDGGYPRIDILFQVLEALNARLVIAADR